MTVDTKELRALVDACKASNCADADDFNRRLDDLYGELSPEAVADLLDEIDSLAFQVETLKKVIAVKDEVAALQNENHETRAKIISGQDERLKLRADQVNALKEANQALKEVIDNLYQRTGLIEQAFSKDAERYRFLRERVLSACRDIDDQGKGMLGVIFKISGDEWLGCDASIDAAMAQAVPT